MADSLRQITGRQLIRLLQKHQFEIARSARHGVSMRKRLAEGRTIVTVVPDTGEALPRGTLMAILGPKQTRLGRQGLLELIRRDP